MIVNDSQHIWRSLDDHRFIVQLQPRKHVDASRVGSQKQGLGIHQVFKNHRCRIGRPEFQNSLANRIHRRNLDAIHVRPVRVLEIQEVVNLLDCLVVGHTVEEVQVTKPGLNLVRGRDPRRDLCRHLHLR